MIAPFTPPHHDQPKRVFESSPAFSNYFSDEETSPQTSGILRPSPSQSRLLGRLNAIGRQILRKDPGEHERTVLSAELDALEQTLNAPEPQSREPPDIADSGLFVDDEPEEQPDKQLEETLAAAKAHLAAERQQRKELTERVNKVVRQVQLRHEEIKHINDLVIARLDLSAQEILRLRSENHKMQAELHHSRSDFVHLKMQLRALQLQAAPYLKVATDDPLNESIERWEADWKVADMRLRDASYEDDEHNANSDVTPIDLTDTSDLTQQSLGSTRPPKSRLTITRPAKVAHHSADPFITENTPPPNEPPERASSIEPIIQSVGSKADEEFSDENEGLSDAQTSKTPWQELWDSLAEFAGIHDS